MPVRTATFSLQDYPAWPNFAGDRLAESPGCGFHRNARGARYGLHRARKLVEVRRERCLAGARSTDVSDRWAMIVTSGAIRARAAMQPVLVQ